MVSKNITILKLESFFRENDSKQWCRCKGLCPRPQFSGNQFYY